jgi:hypothetical protein
MIWAGAPTSGALPADISPSLTIQSVLDGEKRAIEEALVSRVLDIVKRYTEQADANVKLHKRDKGWPYPKELGDYDVLAYFPQKNALLNIECKDILPPYCLKDARRVRERLFGRSLSDQGDLGKVEARANYLSRHAVEIASTLGWKLDRDHPPEVVSVFVSRHSYWWTQFPPRSTNAAFVRVDMLDQFLRDLC